MENIYYHGNGHMGRRLIAILLSKGFEVRALVRETSVDKLPQRCIAVVVNAFAAESFSVAVPTGCTLLQLLVWRILVPVKTSLKTDRSCICTGICGSRKKAGAVHFVYVSVAQERTNIMSDYQQMSCAGRGGD